MKEAAERRDALPDPVRRYLRLAIPDTALTSPVASVHLTHGGTFRTSPKGRWFPIKGEQDFTVAEPGFVWKGRISPMPLVTITATDRLENGHGSMKVRAWSIIPIVTATGPKLDQSSAARWLMEAVWFPCAYLGPLIRWTAIDAATARVSLTNTVEDVSAIAHFDSETGLLDTITSNRYMNETQMPFLGRCSDYRQHNGFLIPTRMRGAWELPAGEFPYVDFLLKTIEYS